MQSTLGKKIGTGANADVYEYGAGKIVKLFNSLDHARGIHEEFRHTMAVWQNGLPVPQPYEIVDIDGLPGLVMEHIEGIPLASTMLNGDYKKSARILARLQYQLHTMPVDKLDPKDFNSVKGNLTWMINRQPCLSADEKSAVLSRLEALPDGHSLCHGDLHMLNVIMRGEEPVVIDWQGTTIGCPAYDVMQLLILLRYAVIPEGMLPQELIDNFYLTRDEMEREFLDEYLALSKMTLDEIEAWLAPCAASRLWSDICEEERQNVLSAIRSAVAAS